jgi:hypothetical protein
LSTCVVLAQFLARLLLVTDHDDPAAAQVVAADRAQNTVEPGFAQLPLTFERVNRSWS